MSISIDPTQRRGSPVSKDKVIGATGGKKVVDMTGEHALEKRAKENAGIAVETAFDKDQIAKVAQGVVRSSGRKLYEGDPELEQVLDKLISHIAGDKFFGKDLGSGARYGFLGMLARRLPRPILLDHEEFAEDLFPPDNKTFCVDPSGRMWIYAPFMRECLKKDAEEGLMTLPVLNHEHMHIALEHCMRMHNFDPRISNIAKDTAINPMVKKLYPENTRFAKDFQKAWGNREEDKRFENLSEETIAKIMQSEAVENAKNKGTIKIKLLEIVDGPVKQKTELKAGKDEVLELDHVVVTVEEIFNAKGESVGDKIDTEFDCAICEIEQTINKLKPRRRKSNGGQSSDQESIVDIPVISSGKDKGEGKGEDGEPGEDGEGSDNGDDENNNRKVGPRRLTPSQGSDEGGGSFNSPSGHELDLEKLKRILKKHGLNDVLDDIKPDSYSDDTMKQIIEQSLTEAQLEQTRLGPLYPGAHINDYMRDVVKPSLKHRVTWQQRVREFLQGEGPELARSMEEQSIITLLDPEDLGMEEDEVPILPGLLPQRPDGRMLVMIDSSGSMDGGRLVEAVSFIVGMRQSADDMSPPIDVVSADTAVRGEPETLTDEALAEAMDKGFAVNGRGGTEITVPLNQMMAYAEENDITYSGVIYITDLGFCAPPVEALPPKLPPMLVLAIPADYKASSQVVKDLEVYAEVAMIDKDMTLNLEAAEAKAHIRGEGLEGMSSGPRP